MGGEASRPERAPEKARAAPAKADPLEAAHREAAAAARAARARLRLPDLGYARDLDRAYEVGELIGKGSFGRVYRGRALRGRAAGREVAVKRVPKQSLKTPQDVAWLKQEVEIMQRLSNSLNVVHFHEAFEDELFVYIVMELCSGGDLVRRILKVSVFEEEDAKPYMADILRLAEQCHTAGVVHRDIKPDNFLLAEKSSRAPLKMTDFGLAEYWRGEPMDDVTGTPLFMAPEVLYGRYGPECDLWSCGCVMYFLLTGRTPFESMGGGKKVSIDHLVKKIKYAPIDLKAYPWNHISDEAKDLVRGLLERKVSKRLTAVQALNHPWFSSLKKTVSGGALENSMVQRMQHSASFNSLKKNCILHLITDMADDEIAEFRNIFKKIDHNHDGAITPREMLVGLDGEGYTLSEQETMWMMGQIDIDGNGRVSEEEFVTSLVDLRQVQNTRKFQTYVNRLYQRIDADKSGAISIDEVAEYLHDPPREELERVLEQVDKDKDGAISLGEFKEMLHEAVRTFERFDERLSVRYKSPMTKNPSINIKQFHSLDRPPATSIRDAAVEGPDGSVQLPPPFQPATTV